jgi:subtilisin family serine protease
MADPKKRAARRASTRAAGAAGGRGTGDGIPEPRNADGRLSVLVELRSSLGMTASFAANDLRAEAPGGLELDEEFVPVPMGAGRGLGMAFAAGVDTSSYVVRAVVDDEAAMGALQQRPDVVAVWRDTPIAPFACPIPPCDCQPNTPHGTIADVATYLGATQIWSAGVKGQGMVVGVVDGGITAQGRPVIAGETPKRIARVIGGWPTADWGTQASVWGEHGNMCGTAVLGMAPEAQLYDLRISGTDPGIPATISRALQAFQWAIDQHKANGTPHVLTNSWGIFQEAWDESYAKDANHPFTRKVVEAIEEGIIMLFSAGNCGGTCPDGRCGPDNGPGKSIWGANGHPRVLTVGAVNKDEQFVGYSSQGPAALDPNKPDVCSVTHYVGYTPCDNGTSAATPILAGVVALLKQAAPSVTQDGVKNALKSTAKDIGPVGFDQHSGAGIVQGKAAYDKLTHLSFLTRTPVCSPSVVQVCRTITAVCNIQPSFPGHICIRATSPIICRPPQVSLPRCVPQPSRICPSFGVCPSIACGEPGNPVVNPVADAQVEQAWASWYGYDDAAWSDEEQWYGQ